MGVGVIPNVVPLSSARRGHSTECPMVIGFSWKRIAQFHRVLCAERKNSGFENNLVEPAHDKADVDCLIGFFTRMTDVAAMWKGVRAPDRFEYLSRGPP